MAESQVEIKATAVPKRDPRKHQYEKNKCHKKLRRLVGEALTDFNMLSEGDKVMVCLSGGKDSYTLLDMMLTFKQHAPINFDVVAVNLDQKQPGFPEQVLPQYLSGLPGRTVSHFLSGYLSFKSLKKAALTAGAPLANTSSTCSSTLWSVLGL